MKKTITKNGFTLLETLLVVGLIGVSSAGIYATYNKSSAAAKISHEAKNISIIQEGILNIYANDSSFQNLDNTMINNSSVAPNSMRDGTSNGIGHVFGSQVIVSSATTFRANDTAMITYEDVPSEYCAKLVSDVKDKFDRVEVDGTSIRDNGVDNTNVELLPALCNANNNNNLEFSLINYSVSGGSAPIDPPFDQIRPIYSTPLP